MKMNDFYEVDGCMDFIPVKLIKEHKHITNNLEVESTESGYITFVPNMYSFPKINEPQKPVVPKFVAEFIEECKASRRSLRDSMKGVYTHQDVNAWLLRNGREMYTYPNQGTFARAWLDGYEVEKEKLYTVEIADAILTKITRGREHNVKYRMLPYKDIYKFFNDCIYTNFLTETEIKQADERLWQFANPVEAEDE